MANIQRTSANTGETTYTVQVRLSGFPTQTATFKRKTDAKNWAQQTEAAAMGGTSRRQNRSVTPLTT